MDKKLEAYFDVLKKERLNSQNCSSSRGLANIKVLSWREHISFKSEYGKICCSAWSLAIYLKHLLVSWLMQIQTLVTPPSHGRTVGLIVEHSLKSWPLLVWTPALRRHIKDTIQRGGEVQRIYVRQQYAIFKYLGLELWVWHINPHFFKKKLQTLLIKSHTSIALITISAPLYPSIQNPIDQLRQ